MDEPPATPRVVRVAGLLACLAGAASVDTDTVARVGGIAIDAQTFRQRVARVSELDWRELGSDWHEQRRRFLDEVLIDEALLSLAAERAPPALPPARDRALARTLDAALVDEAARLAPSEADVREYRTRHDADFGAPRAIGIWRILLTTEADARRTLAELAPITPELFSRLARERSIDRATHMRAGNLGLVAADGQTAVPELRVAPALFAAADQVADGELVPEPVREGHAFAVVWRRTSRAARELPVAEAARWIASRLAERSASDAQQALLERLRREHLADYRPEPAIDYEPRFPEARAPLPRLAPAPSRQPRLVPELTDRGLR